MIRGQAELAALEARFAQERMARQLDRLLQEGQQTGDRLLDNPRLRLLGLIRFLQLTRVFTLPS